MQTLEHLEKMEGFEVTWLDVSAQGLIDPEQLERAIRAGDRVGFDHDGE